MVKLLWKELEYDIEQQTFRIAGARLSDAAKVEVRDLSQMDKSKSNLDYMMRFCETGVARCRVLLKDKLVDKSTGRGFWTGWGEYNANEIDSEGETFTDREWDSTNEETVTDALDRSRKDWDFQFGSDVDEHAMAMLLHCFVVRYCLWQWCRTFSFTDATGSFKDELDDVEKQLEDMLYDIEMPKKYHEWHDFKRRPIDEVEITSEVD